MEKMKDINNRTLNFVMKNNIENNPNNCYAVLTIKQLQKIYKFINLNNYKKNTITKEKVLLFANFNVKYIPNENKDLTDLMRVINNIKLIYESLKKAFIIKPKLNIFFDYKISDNNIVDLLIRSNKKEIIIEEMNQYSKKELIKYLRTLKS